MQTMTEQQVLSVAKLLEGLEDGAKEMKLAPLEAAAALAIAAGSYAAHLQVPLEDTLDLVARAHNGAREGAASAAEPAAAGPEPAGQKGKARRKRT